MTAQVVTAAWTVCEHGLVASGGGKRAAPRRAARPSRPRAQLLLTAVGVTATIVAWGYLVVAAIDFGASARGGQDEAWLFLGIATLGATACLFAGLMLAARALRLLGITRQPPPPGAPPPPRGGKRAAR